MCAAFDPGSLIFAVASADNTIAFFDRRNYDKVFVSNNFKQRLTVMQAPFAQYQMDFPPFSWRALEFSPNGQFVLLVTDKDVVLLMDAFTGNLVLP